MKISIKLFVVISTSLFAAEPIAFGQNGSTPPRPTDISGSWLMEFGTCKGSISISPPLNSGGDNWNGIWTGQCGSDALRVQYTISEKYESINPYEINRGGGGYPYEAYHFSGSGSFSNGVVVTGDYDLNWTPLNDALAGSGYIAIGSSPKRLIAASVHK
jgi:hypothetical protein